MAEKKPVYIIIGILFLVVAILFVIAMLGFLGGFFYHMQ